MDEVAQADFRTDAEREECGGVLPRQTQSARMWVYVGDQENPYNVFDVTLNRGREGPKEFLKDYTEVLLADAYGGYNGVVAGNAITRAGCWSHARRKFVEAEKTAPEIAREAVALMDALFAVERQAKDVAVAERLELRQKQSVPILTELHRKLLVWKEQLLPKHPMADAVNYTLGQWDALTVFTTDGAVPADNNVSEREMKRVVLNRNNVGFFVGRLWYIWPFKHSCRACRKNGTGRRYCVNVREGPAQTAE